MKKSIITIIVSFFLLTNIANAQTEKYHAMFIYNFTKFMQWDNLSGNDFVITVVGNSKLAKSLQTVALTKKVGARNLVIKHVETINSAGKSQMLILGKDRSSFLNSAKVKANSLNALLISEKSGHAKNGAGISFKSSSGKIGFDINKGAIAANNIKINSKLEALGTVVN